MDLAENSTKIGSLQQLDRLLHLHLHLKNLQNPPPQFLPPLLRGENIILEPLCAVRRKGSRNRKKNRLQKGLQSHHGQHGNVNFEQLPTFLF